MDERLTRCVLGISGRPHCVYKSSFSQPRLGEMDTEMFPHWFHSFAQAAGITLHIEMLYGENNHHIAESMYKALARALRQAVEIDPRKRSEEHTSELQSLMRISYAVFCLKKKNRHETVYYNHLTTNQQ